MKFLSDFAYGFYVGPLPLIAVVGFVTYALFLIAALVMAARRWNKRLARRVFKLHRWIALAALLTARFHLLLGLASYV